MPPELLTGLIALSGVLVGYLFHFLTSHIDRRERRHRLLREKYEELCKNILDSTREVQDMTMTLQTSVQPVPPVAPQKAHYLALVYFPELKQATADYSNACTNYHKFLLEARHIYGQPAKHPKFHAEAESVMEAKSRVDELIETHASRYTKA